MDKDREAYSDKLRHIISEVTGQECDGTLQHAPWHQPVAAGDMARISELGRQSKEISARMKGQESTTYKPE